MRVVANLPRVVADLPRILRPPRPEACPQCGSPAIAWDGETYYCLIVGCGWRDEALREYMKKLRQTEIPLYIPSLPSKCPSCQRVGTVHWSQTDRTTHQCCACGWKNVALSHFLKRLG